MRKAGAFAATVLGAMLLAGGPALSDPPGGCPPGLAKKDRCEQYPHYKGNDRDRWGDRDRDRDRRRTREREDRAYEEGYRDAMEDAWRVGQRLPRDRYRVVPDYNEFGWPDPGAGRGYVRHDEQYYLINMATGLILDILSR